MKHEHEHWKDFEVFLNCVPILCLNKKIKINTVYVPTQYPIKTKIICYLYIWYELLSVELLITYHFHLGNKILVNSESTPSRFRISYNNK